MKLVFICAALEPGRDGVGDYTRRLAGECTARGHGCTIIALHDPHVTRVSEATAHDVRLIRLPAAAPWPDRLTCAADHLRRLAPDWVSWQLVAYGFHPRGFLPAALLQRAADLAGPRCQVMLHELWLGLEAGASWRARATGWLQRRGVLCLLAQLDPECVQTSNAAYQEVLRRAGLDARVLGLFGNVPIAAGDPAETRPLARWWPAANTPRGDRPLVALTFGTLHPQWRPDATITWLLATARRLGRPPALIAAGRLGPSAAAILAAFRRRGIPVVTTGELDETTLSHLLRAADFGIAPHPWALIGKSGTAAAMLEHGLPVLVPRNDWRLRGASTLPFVAPNHLLVRLEGLTADDTDRWLAARRAPESTLPQIAGAWLENLETTAAPPAPIHS